VARASDRSNRRRHRASWWGAVSGNTSNARSCTTTITSRADVGGGTKLGANTMSDAPASHSSLGEPIRALIGPNNLGGILVARSTRLADHPANRRDRVPIPRTSRYHATPLVSGPAGG